jgi:hypothetical protein
LNQQSSEGEFTRLLRKVSRQPPVVKTSNPAPAPNRALSADGPGEFTRVVAQSMQREAARYNKGLPETYNTPTAPPNEAAIPPGQPLLASQSRVNSPEEAAPAQSKEDNQHHASASPVDPQAMLYTAQEAGRMMAGGSQSVLSHVREQAYTASSHSSRMRTTASSRPAGGNRLQEHVPVLLIANLFLTVLLLLLVGFELLHRS